MMARSSSRPEARERLPSTGDSPERTKPQPKKPLSLFRCLVKAFYFELLVSSLIRVVGDCVQFANPALLNSLIQYLENKERYPGWFGYTLVAGFFVVTFITSICLNQNLYHVNNIGMKIKTALVATVYRKALNMSNEGRRQYTSGAIVNFMAVDCQKMQTVTTQVWVLLAAPLQISLAFYFLNDKLGASFLVGVGIIILLIPVNIKISIAARQYQAQQLVLKDQRLKMISEVLGGMKVIKLSAWEESFYKRVTEIRDEEVRCLKKVALFTTITVFTWICSPILVTMGTLLTYTFVSEKGYLDPATAFVSMSLFNILKQPINQLPECISELVQSHVSLKRLGNFLSCEELNPSDICRDAEDGVALCMKNGTLSWDRSLPPALSRINLEVRERQLVAVVGPVGAGKSSLLSAFLGEMRKLKGNVWVRGSVAYVPQQAWIQNRPLRDCVLFDSPMDYKRYRKIVRSCALKPDIETFPAGDLTEIGEKGINLSGGQKLRVSLARAVYQDCDVYLLDDPLSAVDSHVGKHIFRKVISASGLLKNKARMIVLIENTRVMVTHGIHWLPMCDSIVVMDQGHIVQTGTYEQLLKHDGPFAQYLKTHLRQDTDDLDPEIQKILGQMHVRVEGITSDGMTSADEDDFRIKKKSSRPRERAAHASGKGGHPGDSDQGRQLVQEERTQTGRIKGFVLKEILRAFGVGAAVIAVMHLLLYNVMGIAANIWLSRWTDDSLLRNVSLAGTAAYSERTLMYVGVFAALGVLQSILTFLFVGTIYVKMISASRHLHANMLNNILHQPMIFFDTNPLGRILNRFSRDVDAVDGSMARLVRMFAMQVFTVVSVLCVITYSTPVFVAAAIPMTIIYYLVQMFYIPSSRQLRRNESVSRSPMYSHFSETINGAASIRAFGVGSRFQKESERLVDQNNCFFYGFVSASRWLRIRLELLGNLIVVFAALFAVLTDDVSGSIAGLSVSHALQVTAILTKMIQNSTQLESNIISVERLVEYIKLPQEPPWVIKNTRPPAPWPTKGLIRYNKYSTRYRPGLDLVLHSITCTVHCGEKVGIVGRTGAGKSSLSLSIFRLLEAAEGSITIDNINIATIGLHDLRSRLTILPQDPVLFSGSLRFNLDPLYKYTDTDVWASLEQAKLKDFVHRQPQGLLCEVDEGGQNLSVGQRQLVCLARALLRRTKVLVLDEATAAVDLETDDLIQKTLRTAFHDCTVLTIAHRLNTVMDYDKIIVLENGRIVEMDSPDSLLEDRGTIFYRMVQEAQLMS
ncbi:multidrug resistance-associated protein 1-like [Littorina saxatilis]|uniref:multidrug resistance-associated protein 1-like n=1 Tax=Littorina saxatilis TaxID=31220 RepID=UPI0038B67D9D